MAFPSIDGIDMTGACHECCEAGCNCDGSLVLYATFSCPGDGCIDGITFPLDLIGDAPDVAGAGGGRIKRTWLSRSDGLTPETSTPCSCDSPIEFACDVNYDGTPGSANPNFGGACYGFALCSFGDPVTSLTVNSTSPLDVTIELPDYGLFGPCTVTVTN